MNEGERGPPVIQSALIGVAASPTVERFAYPLTYHRQFDTMQSGLASRDGMQFDQLKRREFITLLSGAGVIQQNMCAKRKLFVACAGCQSAIGASCVRDHGFRQVAVYG
jgi:hypothetical protein